MITCIGYFAHTQDTLTTSASLNRPLKTIDRLESISVGFGLGLDMGGIGMSFVAYPNYYLGLFAGAGYTFAGTGANAGLKIRLVGKESRQLVIPYWTAMYGNNAVVLVENAKHLNKQFTGGTIGFGIDIKPVRPQRKLFTSLAVLVPLRDSSAKDYLNSIGARIRRDFFPIALSLGLRIELD